MILSLYTLPFVTLCSNGKSCISEMCQNVNISMAPSNNALNWSPMGSLSEFSTVDCDPHSQNRGPSHQKKDEDIDTSTALIIQVPTTEGMHIPL